MFEEMVNTETSEKKMNLEVQSADEYRKKYQQAKVEIARTEEEPRQPSAMQPYTRVPTE